MRIEKLTVKKDGKTYHGDVVWPDNLGVALQLLGESEVWQAFKLGYKEITKRRITGQTIRPRRQVVRIDLATLDEPTRLAIEEIAKLQAVQQAPQPSEQTPQPEPLPIAESGFDEMPEEVPDEFFYSGPELDQEPAIDSSALDS